MLILFKLSKYYLKNFQWGDLNLINLDCMLMLYH